MYIVPFICHHIRCTENRHRTCKLLSHVRSRAYYIFTNVQIRCKCLLYVLKLLFFSAAEALENHLYQNILSWFTLNKIRFEASMIYYFLTYYLVPRFYFLYSQSFSYSYLCTKYQKLFRCNNATYWKTFQTYFIIVKIYATWQKVCSTK